MCIAPGGTFAVDTNLSLSFRFSVVLLRGFVGGGYVVSPFPLAVDKSHSS